MDCYAIILPSFVGSSGIFTNSRQQFFFRIILRSLSSFMPRRMKSIILITDHSAELKYNDLHKSKEQHIKKTPAWLLVSRWWREEKCIEMSWMFHAREEFQWGSRTLKLLKHKSTSFWTFTASTWAFKAVFSFAKKRHEKRDDERLRKETLSTRRSCVFAEEVNRP